MIFCEGSYSERTAAEKERTCSYLCRGLQETVLPLLGMYRVMTARLTHRRSGRRRRRLFNHSTRVPVTTFVRCVCKRGPRSGSSRLFVVHRSGVRMSIHLLPMSALKKRALYVYLLVSNYSAVREIMVPRYRVMLHVRRIVVRSSPQICSQFLH